ncbi:MAG: presqualene diphosphate synthase HpnD [Myxococcales bacterium]|nr:presqualene diphosphate synthase HpnD [Myxococcales bacterium]
MNRLPDNPSEAEPNIAEAYRECAEITRRSGSSFASAFWMLPKPKRNALHAIYAFCRLADDIADDPEVAGDRTALLARWREELDGAYRGKAQHAVGVALSDAVERFRLPEGVFLDLLAGVEFDLADGPIETFDDLRLYCYRVASTVGLLVVRILGFKNPRSLEFAETLGIAVQLTNVLRDVGDDASTGRIYLPRDELERFGVSTGSVLAGHGTDALQPMLRFSAERAASYYERAEDLLPDEDRRSLRPATAMGRIYRALLDELIEREFPCFEQPLRLSKPRRIAIAAKVWMGMA